jgi:signal transduction histidine kinase/CheY-like chemotaxis protein
MKIRGVLVLLFAGVFVPLAALNLANVWTTYQAERSGLASNLLDTARALSLTVDRELGRAMAVAQTLAATEQARERQLQQLDSFGREVLPAKEGWAVILADLSGQQLVNTVRPFGSALPIRGSLAGTEHLVRTGEAYVSDVFISAVTQAPAAEIDVPVYRHGEIEGVLSISVPLAGMAAILAEQDLDEQWIAGILDRQGNHVARSRNWESFVLQKPSAALLQAMAEGSHGIVQGTTPDDIEIMGAFSTSPLYGWTVFVHVPEDVIRGGLIRSAVMNLATLGVVAALALLAAVVLAEWIARPVRALVPAASQIYQGTVPSMPSFRLYEAEEVRRSLVVAATELLRRSQERDRALKDLSSLNQQLEERVDERTDEVRRKHQELLAEIDVRTAAEAQLRQVQKLEAVGALTGGIAHDFNNLLQIVQGNLELISDKVNDPAARRKLENALEGTRRGAALTRQLLAFARKQPLEPKVVNPGRLLRGMMDMLHRTIGEAISIETMIAGGLWNCRVDPNQLETALLNVAVNARDAMPSGGSLTIELDNAFLDHKYAAAHAEVTPGQYVMIAVTDTGRGMDRQIAERAFEPFFTTKGVGEGTGLGLSQVFGFVKQSAGHVKLYTEPGRGTTVKIYLPRARGAEEVASANVEEAQIPAGLTVLLVEDEPEVRASISGMLQNLGMKVVEAGNGEEALARLEEHHIDMVLTDVVMPGPVTSRELARLVGERRPGTPVLFTSGYTENAIIHQGELDADASLISKPFSQMELAQKIAVVLAGRLPAEPGHAGDEGTETASSLSVLLVEDDVMIGQTGIEMIEGLGHRATHAISAEEALDVLEKNGKFDIVLTDISLAGKSGIELAREVRRKFPGVPLVAITGRSATSLDDSSLFDEVIGKPYSPSDIAAGLRAAQP